VAREAGVSHAAPTHHFGDATGLLSELAAVGFRNFNATMSAAGETGTTPIESATARARAYLAYARAQPGMYQLMFRTERLDMTRPGLREAADASFRGLANVVGARHPGEDASDALTLEQAALIARAWSLVHGFTMLTIDGRLADIMGRLPDGTDPERLFVEMLKVTIAKAD
jgi:AcrR family transcriptional regulator